MTPHQLRSLIVGALEGEACRIAETSGGTPKREYADYLTSAGVVQGLRLAMSIVESVFNPDDDEDQPNA